MFRKCIIKNAWFFNIQEDKFVFVMTALARKIMFKSLALSLAQIQEAYIPPSSLCLCSLLVALALQKCQADTKDKTEAPSSSPRHSGLVTALGHEQKGQPTVKEWKWGRKRSLSTRVLPSSRGTMSMAPLGLKKGKCQISLLWHWS